MAVVSVTFDGTRVDDADLLTSAKGDWVDTGGKAAAEEPDFVYQGSQSVSEKVGTTALGVGLETAAGTPSSYDFTTPLVGIYKVIATNPGVMLDKASLGGVIEIGSGSAGGNLDEYYAVGGDTYPIRGGWLIIPIDPNGTPSNTPGTAPTLTALDWFGWRCDFSGASKAPNVAMDAFDYIENGTGLTLISGDTGTDGAFQDFVDEDEGTLANRWGIVSTQEGIIYVTGTLTIGSATLTEFTDSGQVLVFPDAEFLNSTGFFGIDIDLQTSGTIITIDSCVFKSAGGFPGTGLSSIDTRPNYTFSGTAGIATIDGCRFDTFNIISSTSAVTLSDCFFGGGEKLDAYGTTISGGIFVDGTQSTGLHYVLVTDPADISTSSFTSGGSGHGIRCDTIGTYDWISNSDFGYTGTRGTNSIAASGSTDAMFYNNSGGLITLDVSGVGGLQPSVRNGIGATTTVSASVSLSISGVTEGTRVILIGDGGDEEGSTVLEAYADSTGEVSGSFAGATPQAVKIRARNSGIINAAVQHDEGGVDTDFTDAARESAGSNDVTLLPAVPATDDAFYYGGIAKFAEVLVNITTVGDTFVLAWEYWNGAWTSLTVIDNTSSYTSSGWSTITFAAPSDWSTTSFAGFGPFYYIRSRVTTGGGTQPFAQNITLNQTTKYLPFNGSGTIQASTGLAATAVWIVDSNNP